LMENGPVVLGMARTPQGKMLGVLKDISAVQLGAIAIKEAIARSSIAPAEVEEVMMGCVLPAGLGQAPARQAALGAGLSAHVACTTLNKVCGSGMAAIMNGVNMLQQNAAQIVVAGGMESMSGAPYLCTKARQGYRLGHGVFLDHMLYDGLEDPYEKGVPMGLFAERCAKTHHLSRTEQDHFAGLSLERAKKAIEEEVFDEEIVGVPVQTKNGVMIVMEDEHPGSVDSRKIPHLPPAFSPEGTITAANSSVIADGAAALVLTNSKKAQETGINPLAYLRGQAVHADEPHQFPLAPIGAIRKLLKNLNWQIEEVDLFEINEAFAVVPLLVMRELRIPHDKVNIYGGACAVGHPIGASGARIVVTLINALRKKGLKKGIAALCIGGGEATAVGVEV
jgi:acetyl-CoA C-acetyltransferase